MYWPSREPDTKSKPTLTQHWQDVPLQLKLPSSWTKFSNSASFIWGKSVNIKSENSLRIQNGPLESINMQVKIYNTPLFFSSYIDNLSSVFKYCQYRLLFKILNCSCIKIVLELNITRPWPYLLKSLDRVFDMFFKTTWFNRFLAFCYS